MSDRVLRLYAASALAAALIFAPCRRLPRAAIAKAAETAAKAAAEARQGRRQKSRRDRRSRQGLSGPAGNPECVWLGRRVVSLLWRDDLDTAFRHLDLYDRFGCPGGHIQATFRCLVRQGNIDPKAPEASNAPRPRLLDQSGNASRAAGRGAEPRRPTGTTTQ